MRAFQLCLVLALSVVAIRATPSITSIEVVGGQGEEEDEPIPAEEDYSLRCYIASGDTYSSCLWTHMIDGDYDDSSRDFEVRCSGGDPDTGNGKSCTNPDGDPEVDGYASKITMDMGSNYCGIRISEAEYWDNGDWECYVGDGITSTSSRIEVFVANMSQVYFSEPDQMDDDSQTIIYQYDDKDGREIEATCRAYGALPAVTEFHWYMDNDRNEIDVEGNSNSDDDKSDTGSISVSRIQEGSDGNNRYYEQTIRWSPTIDDLCDDLDLDQEVCDHNKQKYRNFEFNLLCKVEQGDYFRNELDDEVAEIVVEVTDSAVSTAASLATLSLSLFVAFRSA